MKKLYGIIGHPVGHSLSPAMHNAAFSHLKVDAEYASYEVAPLDLEDFLSGMAKKGISGINVTIPHKVKAKEYLEAKGLLDKEAAKLGAVNTINVEGGALKGYNTDGPGFYRSLVLDLKFEPEGKNVFVLGAGGAASAIVMYLGAGPEKIFISDVDETKTSAIQAQYNRYFKADKLEACVSKDLRSALQGVDLFINATPVGMKEEDPSPVDVGLLRERSYVYDLVYNRPSTRLVKEASARKLRAVTGLGMLLYQGAIAFEIWTGLKAPVAVMKKALKEAL